MRCLKNRLCEVQIVIRVRRLQSHDFKMASPIGLRVLLFDVAVLLCFSVNGSAGPLPLVINTWPFTNATLKGIFLILFLRIWILFSRSFDIIICSGYDINLKIVVS